MTRKPPFETEDQRKKIMQHHILSAPQEQKPERKLTPRRLTDVNMLNQHDSVDSGLQRNLKIQFSSTISPLTLETPLRLMTPPITLLSYQQLSLTHTHNRSNPPNSTSISINNPNPCSCVPPLSRACSGHHEL